MFAETYYAELYAKDVIETFFQRDLFPMYTIVRLDVEYCCIIQGVTLQMIYIPTL